MWDISQWLTQNSNYVSRKVHGLLGNAESDSISEARSVMESLPQSGLRVTSCQPASACPRGHCGTGRTNAKEVPKDKQQRADGFSNTSWYLHLILAPVRIFSDLRKLG